MRRKDHPRIRGEHHKGVIDGLRTAGSSPHTRGAPRFRSCCRRRLRIIPAYAGSTIGEDSGRQFEGGSSPHTRGAPSPTHGTRPMCPDHPRIRGEHTPPWPCHAPWAGSSPHTRGAQQVDGHVVQHRGIIPAYAGSTQIGVDLLEILPDHPRIRGEHLVLSRRHPPDEGSSPHTRGALFLPSLSSLLMMDHPRIRGEHSTPPRSRPRHPRIIPAYAGSTQFEQSSPHSRGDHPRIRGEHDPSTGMSLQQMGSSPHTRGARLGCQCCQSGVGIIPAYAGSTVSVERAVIKSADHPRIRGEHWSRRDTFDRAKGSSPHTRGAQRSPTPSPTSPLDHPRIRGEHTMSA